MFTLLPNVTLLTTLPSNHILANALPIRSYTRTCDRGKNRRGRKSQEQQAYKEPIDEPKQSSKKKQTKIEYLKKSLCLLESIVSMSGNIDQVIKKSSCFWSGIYCVIKPAMIL